MRDYKHVTVPKSYRTRQTRTAVKRVRTDRSSVRTAGESGGLTKALLKVVILILFASAGFLVWQGYRVIMHADVFAVSGVDVKGVKQLTDRELKDLAGYFSGQNIFRVDLEAAARRARTMPWVEDVRIHRRLPNRITMVFTERIASYILDGGTARFLMDRSGVIIEKVTKENAADWQLPVIAIHSTKPRSGEQVTATGLAEAVRLLDEIEARGGWRTADVTVYADTPDSIAAVYQGTVFKMGSGRYEEKLRRLGEIMADVNSRGIQVAYVDLRPERQAAVKRR